MAICLPHLPAVKLKGSIHTQTRILGLVGGGGGGGGGEGERRREERVVLEHSYSLFLDKC